MPEGHDTTIEVSNIMSFVLYIQILKQSVLKPASPGITLKLTVYNQRNTETLDKLSITQRCGPTKDWSDNSHPTGTCVVT